MYADEELRRLQHRKAALRNIKNKQKRNAVFAKLEQETRELRTTMRKKRQRAAEEAVARGEEEPSKRAQASIESLRAFDDTMVAEDDVEVATDEAEDEFASIFAGHTRPKTLITTKIQPSAHIYPFVRELLMVFPGSVFYRRGRYPLKRICLFAQRRAFTHVMVVGERGKQVASLLVVKLAEKDAASESLTIQPSVAATGGPTALFRVTSATLGADIHGHGNPTRHRPEVILNRFSTRLGHRVGRLLGSLFPHDPEFRGRRVVTFHNQRDFVFVRHHRYIFEHGGQRARLQELGPRLTLQLKWLQAGTFDTRLGDFEWFHRGRQLGSGRKRFHL